MYWGLSQSRMISGGPGTQKARCTQNGPKRNASQTFSDDVEGAENPETEVDEGRAEQERGEQGNVRAREGELVQVPLVGRVDVSLPGFRDFEGRHWRSLRAELDGLGS